MWLPALLGAGMSAASNAFAGVEDPQLLASLSRRPGDFLDPRLQLEQQMRDRAQLQGIMAQRAAGPVNIPGAFVQPLGVRAGGGLPGPVGVTAQDPALFNPQQYLYRPGAQFAQPDWSDPALAAWENPGQYESDLGKSLIQNPNYRQNLPSSKRWIEDFDVGGATSKAPLQTKRWFGGEYAPRYTSPQGEWTQDEEGEWSPPTDTRPQDQRFTGLDQPDIPGTPTVGGGIPRLMANLELLGVRENPETGVLGMDPADVGPVANPDLFMGSGYTNPRGGIPAEDVDRADTGPLLGSYDPGYNRRVAKDEDVFNRQAFDARTAAEAEAAATRDAYNNAQHEKQQTTRRRTEKTNIGMG
jgi:hypothetical protein